MLFLGHVFPTWKTPLQRVALGQCGIGAIELLIDIASGQRGRMNWLNNLLVLTGFAGMFVALRRVRALSPDARPVGIAGGLFALSAVTANLGGLGVFCLPVNVEQFGFAAFWVVLARLVIWRALDGASRLKAIDQELQTA